MPVPLRVIVPASARACFGFGLVETLVAAALLSIVMAAALAALASGTQALAFGERETAAIFLAEEKLERIRAWARSAAPGQGFASLADGTCAAPPDGPCGPEEPGGASGHADVRRVARLAAVSPTLQLVEVEVTYGIPTAPRHVTLATLVAAR